MVLSTTVCLPLIGERDPWIELESIGLVANFRGSALRAHLAGIEEASTEYVAQKPANIGLRSRYCIRSRGVCAPRIRAREDVSGEGRHTSIQLIHSSGSLK